MIREQETDENNKTTSRENEVNEKEEDEIEKEMVEHLDDFELAEGVALVFSDFFSSNKLSQSPTALGHILNLNMSLTLNLNILNFNIDLKINYFCLILSTLSTWRLGYA